jgi:hypothetical protein
VQLLCQCACWGVTGPLVLAGLHPWCLATQRLGGGQLLLSACSAAAAANHAACAGGRPPVCCSVLGEGQLGMDACSVLYLLPSMLPNTKGHQPGLVPWPQCKHHSLIIVSQGPCPTCSR